MADSTVVDYSKMRVIDLRKELKSRGLPSSGDKTELIAKLQAANQQDDTADINLDSDEIDSDGVLDDDDDKNHSEIILDENGVNDAAINEELVLSDTPLKEDKPTKTLKRKLPPADKQENSAIVADSDKKHAGSKKIVLNRAISITPPQNVTNSIQPEPVPKPIDRVNSTDEADPISKMEMRAKRFGLPIKLTETERKEARKIRFGQNTSTTGNTATALNDNLDKLKKRAERFGQSVSKVMTDLESKERLEKRKAKFATVK